MSLMNVSVHGDYGVLSIDTCLSAQFDDQGRPMENCEVTAAAATAAGHPPAVACGRATKLISLPHMQAVACSNGSLALMSLVHGALANLACADINDFPAVARKTFRIAYEQACEVYGPAMKRTGVSSVIVGYSPSRKAVIGWKFTSLDDFEVSAIVETGSNPSINVDDPHIERLSELMRPADRSIEAARRLHVEIASNQFRTYLAGKYPPGYHCSNEIHIATVSEDEISIKRTFVCEMRARARGGALAVKVG